MSTPGPLLVVEDNEDDAYFMRRALQAAAPAVLVQFVGDGEEAVDYLRGTGNFENRERYPFPALVFLDLKLPLMPGLEVLATIRQDPKLKDLKVFVLTSSSEDRDRQRTQELGIEGYLVKPPTREMLVPILAPAPQTDRQRRAG